MVDDIVEYAIECGLIGKSIMIEMEHTYPDYKLVRRNRKAPDDQSDANLETRREALASNLDRARTAHGRIS